MRSRLVTGLLTILIVTAFTIVDSDFVQTLTKRLQDFKQQSPQVKLFLFFNQPTYMTGDTAYFSIRFLTEDLVPVSGRQIVRVELIDQNGQLAYFQHVSVKDGAGANQVVIPTGLKPGAYQWVAYSEWMKNFHSQFYFKQDLILVEKYDFVKIATDDNLVLSFFPEGGSLVSSINNRIVARSNKVISIVRIVDESGKEVAQLDFDKHGLAHFTLRPQSGTRYYAEAEYQGSVKRFALPDSSPDGLAIDLSLEQSSARLRVARPHDSKLKENLWIVISARSDIYFTSPLNFENKELLSMRFPLEKLPAGICYATIFNERGEVLVERLFVAHSESGVKTEIQKDRSSFVTRSNINLQIRLSDPRQIQLTGEFAISVFNKKFDHKLVTPVSIKDYLLLKSDLITESLPSTTTHAEWNNFLITQKNSRIDWKKVWTEKFDNEYNFKRFIDYSGKAIVKQTQQPVPDSSLVVVYLQKNLMGYEAVTTQDGSFDLPFVLDFWNEDDVFYEVQSKRGRELIAEINWQLDSAAHGRSTLSVVEGESINNYATYQIQNRSINRSFGFYKSGSESSPDVSLDDPNSEFEDEISGADFTINVNEYVVFPTMEEMIREVIPNLQHRKVKGKSQVRVLLPEIGAAPDGPLYIIDGNMTRDTDYFLRFRPSDIITIKVVKTPSKLMQMGPMAKNGIVFVYTKGLNHDALKRTNTMMPVKGINRPIPFHIMDHANSNTFRIPDFRSTLYWNPTMRVDANGLAQINFSASDDIGTFLIYIQGVTTDGRPFEKVDSLSIVFEKN